MLQNSRSARGERDWGDEDEGTIVKDIYNICASVLGFKERANTESEAWNPVNSLRLDLKEAWGRVRAVVSDELAGTCVHICAGSLLHILLPIDCNALHVPLTLTCNLLHLLLPSQPLVFVRMYIRLA